MRRFASLAVAIALILGMLGSYSVARAGALTAAFTSSITYQNVGTGPATISMSFRQAGTTDEKVFNVANLAAGAGASLFVGSVAGVLPGPNSAIISSNQPLVATVVQFVNGDPSFRMRLLSNGLQASDASNQYLVATVLLNKFDRTTVFSVQNTESFAVDATVKFYDADNNGALAGTKTFTIPSLSSKYINMSQSADTGLGSRTVFNGSAIVTATKQGDASTAGKVVASANEYYVSRNVAAAFEGTPLSQASNTVYMATGLCRNSGLETFYAVQNASLTDSATVTVNYRDQSGNPKTSDGPYTIGHGQKVSISTCNPSSKVDMSNFSGSATIVSTGAKIVALGKAQSIIGSTDPRYVDVFTIFAGQPSGANKLALPFVRWAKDADFNAASNNGGKQRAFLAIQNLENKSIKVIVDYNDKVGKTVGTQKLTIPALSKAQSNASTAGALDASGQFGYYNDNTFGGAVIIRPDPADAGSANAKFIAIARVQHPGAGEDYNGQVTP